MVMVGWCLVDGDGMMVVLMVFWLPAGGYLGSN